MVQAAFVQKAGNHKYTHILLLTALPPAKAPHGRSLRGVDIPALESTVTESSTCGMAKETGAN